MADVEAHLLALYFCTLIFRFTWRDHIENWRGQKPIIHHTLVSDYHCALTRRKRPPWKPLFSWKYYWSIIFRPKCPTREVEGYKTPCEGVGRSKCAQKIMLFWALLVSFGVCGVRGGVGAGLSAGLLRCWEGGLHPAPFFTNAQTTVCEQQGCGNIAESRHSRRAAQGKRPSLPILTRFLEKTPTTHHPTLTGKDPNNPSSHGVWPRPYLSTPKSGKEGDYPGLWSNGHEENYPRLWNNGQEGNYPGLRRDGKVGNYPMREGISRPVPAMFALCTCLVQIIIKVGANNIFF